MQLSLRNQIVVQFEKGLLHLCQGELVEPGLNVIISSSTIFPINRDRRD